jgi:Zn-dependent protease with chaperone function
MKQVRGDWFDGKTSAHQQVLVEVDDAGVVVVRTALGQLLLHLSFSDIEISSRVGSTPRYWYFPQGEKLETQDHALVDSLLQKFRPSVLHSLAHQLESHLQFVILTVALVAAMSWWTMLHGLPMASRWVAEALPQAVMDRAARETLVILDKMHFHPTQLDQQTQARVLAHFAPALAENKALNIRVQFRGGGDIGANAFALPDGTVVFTDEIVHLAHNDDELLAVLAHEIGHVKYRHGLRATIQGSVLSFAVGMLVGDVSAAADMLAALPLLLTTSSYSRDFEREADANSLLFLDAHKIPRHSFIDLMERLTYSAHCSALIDVDEQKAAEKAEQEAKGKAKKPAADSAEAAPAATPDVIEKGISLERKARCDKLLQADKNTSLKVLDYFSSHPETDERTAIFRSQPAAQ